MAREAEARTRIVQARTSLVLDHPFFGHLALGMKLVEDACCDTAWSDGITLGYNPVYVNMLPKEKLKGLLAHVVTHPACGHHLRRNHREARLWNMACDYAINWILVEAGLDLPPGFLDDPGLRGMTAEKIYTGLLEERSQALQTSEKLYQKKAPPQGEKTDPGDLQARGGRPDDRATNDQDMSAGENEKVKARQGNDKDRDNDPGRAGEVRDLEPGQQGGSDGIGQDQSSEERWRINLARAVNAARSAGEMPGSLARMIETVLSPVLNWREILSRFIRDAARFDYSWVPPNRRFLHQDIYLPSMRSQDPREVVVAVDTSGSISGPELSRFSAELSAILDACASGVRVIYCDSRVTSSVLIHREDLPLKLEAGGGGGTDFRPVFDWMEKRGVRPMCLIYLTDLACNRFPARPAFPVLWACTGGLDSKPPFGRVVSVN